MGNLSIGRRARRTLLVLLAFGGLAAGAKCSESAQAGPLDTLDSLHFVVHYRTAGFYGASCGEDRFKPGTIGLPITIDLGGSALPDVSVELAAVPGVGGQPSRLEMIVKKLTDNSMKSLIEAVLNPGADSGRVAFGYDGCESGTPKQFNASITSSASKLTLDTSVNNAQDNLTILGSSFTNGPNATRVNATALAARLAPVPQTLSAVVNILSNDAYTATVTPSSRTDLGVLFTKTAGTKHMALNGVLKTLQGKLDFDFSPSLIHYKNASGFTSVQFNLDSYTPPAATVKGVTDRIDVNLTAVPPEARLTRTAKAIEFTPTAGAIGTTLVHYSSLEDGGTPLGPLTIPNSPQYVAGNIQPGSINAQTRVVGLSHAIIDTADPVVVEVTHTAGPLLMDVAQSGRRVVCDTCQIDPTIVTRRLNVSVLNMPATAKVTYSPATGSYTYGGSSVIGELKADVHSSDALVDVAHDSHLRLVSVPTGLSGQINAAEKTFTATITQPIPAPITPAAIGLVEAQVTSGPNSTLPTGTDGILLNDREQSYEAFVRISGLREATVGWGDTQFATLKHTATPFRIAFGADDTNGHADEGIEVEANVLDLPDTVHIEYSPNASNSHFLYTGSDVIAQVNLHVVREKPFMTDTDVDTLNTFIVGLPRYVELDVDATAKTLHAATEPSMPPIEIHAAFVAPQVQSIGGVSVDLCSPTKCRSTQLGDPESISNDTGVDGVFLNDLTSGYDMYARVAHISDASLGWGDTIAAGLTHTAAPFEAHTVSDKTFKKVVFDSFNPPTFHYEDVPYTERADVVVHDLPHTVALTYNSLTSHATYSGSAPINSLTADYTKGSWLTVGGRAHFLHIELADIETGVVFGMHSTATGDSVTVDTGAAKIGGVLFEMASSLEVLHHTTTTSLPVTKGDEDGLVAWDLLDDLLIAHPYADPFLIVGHATNLKHFHFANDAVGDHDSDGGTGTRATRGVELVRVGTNKAVTADIRSSSSPQGAFAPFDGFIVEPFALAQATVSNPPSTIGFTFTAREPDAGSNGPKIYEIKTWGSSAPGSALHFYTDAGAMKALTTDLSPLPAGTAGSPGLRACFSPDSVVCMPAEFDTDGLLEDPLSADLKVSEPVRLEVDADVANSRTIVELDVSSHLSIGKKASTEGSNSTLMYLNTDGTPIGGVFRSYIDGDIDTRVDAPPGTRAIDRWVEIERSGVNDGRNAGLLACPHGFDAHTFAMFKFSLNDDLCTGPALHATSLADDSMPGRTTVDLYGTSFASDTVINDFWYEGTHVAIYDADTNQPANYLEDVVITRDAIDHMSVSFFDRSGERHRIYFVLSPNTDVVDPPSDSSGAGCTCPIRIS